MGLYLFDFELISALTRNHRFIDAKKVEPKHVLKEVKQEGKKRKDNIPFLSSFYRRERSRLKHWGRRMGVGPRREVYLGQAALGLLRPNHDDSIEDRFEHKLIHDPHRAPDR